MQFRSRTLCAKAGDKKTPMENVIDRQTLDHGDRLAKHELQLIYRRPASEAAYHQATGR